MNILRLDIARDSFQRLHAATTLEDVCAGRKGAIIVDVQEGGLVPLVRSTTNYRQAAQAFKDVHRDILSRIPPANNAMVEVYTNEYRRMGFHTDMALDLVEDSFICLFSCYENPDCDQRVLQVKHKTDPGRYFDIPLCHNSAVFFSMETNRNYVHRIVLPPQAATNRWLGVTFRLSKTFVRYTPEPRLNNRILHLASDVERAELHKNKGRENALIAHTYPTDLDYTLSEGDLLNGFK
jgi:hypothetical protein